MYFIKTSPINYADDNTICATGKNLTECLQNCKDDVEQSLLWFRQNQLQAKPAKFQFLHTSDEQNISFTCDNVSLDCENDVKLLGVHVDRQLKFTMHVNLVIRKCARQLNALRRKSKMLNCKTKLLICHSFIEATINYCPLVWVNRNRTDMKRLEKVDKRAWQLVFGKNFTYDELLQKAKACTIEVKWKRQLVEEVFKAVHGLAPPYI
jgi:hypothetical protein